MKKIFFSLVLLLIFIAAKAQKTDSLKRAPTDTTVFTSVEKLPEFPGGNNEFFKYLQKNIHYPLEARSIQKQGKVIVQMIVEKDGSLSHIKVMRKFFPSLDTEAVRVVSASPKWNPGMQNGFSLRVMYIVPITFKLEVGTAKNN